MAAAHGEQSSPGMKKLVAMADPGLRSCSALMKWCNSTTVSLEKHRGKKREGFIGCWGAGHGDGEVAAQSGGGGPAKVVEQRKKKAIAGA
jgi:hypothetical protein